MVTIVEFADLLKPKVAIGLIQGLPEDELLRCQVDRFVDEQCSLLSPDGAAGNQDIGVYGVPDKKLSDIFCLLFTFRREQTVIITLTSLFTSRLRVSEKDDLLGHRAIKLANRATLSACKYEARKLIF